jgi:hypothetical protein
MSEGLGQKYGAPRRRAQEKMRTAVSRDEGSAGRVDELLARLEFICAEESLRERTSDKSSELSDSTVCFDKGEVELTMLHSTWTLLCTLRIALKQRVDFLKVEAGVDLHVPLKYAELPWLIQQVGYICIYICKYILYICMYIYIHI